MTTRLTMHMHLITFILFVEVWATATASGVKPPKGVSLSFPRFTPEAMKCVVEASAKVSEKDVCGIISAGNEVLFSSQDVVSARYQYAKKVKLCSSKIKAYAASFSTSFVIQFQRSGDRVETDNYFSFGGGWAFAITPDLRVGSSGPESLGLFEIDGKTGRSLRGEKTKTVAVELDISRNSGGVSFPDPQIPHVGLDINSVHSVVAASLGNFTTFVDRHIAVFIDYDAQYSRLDVRVEKLRSSHSSPNKKKATLFISYSPLRLCEVVNEDSFVGFSTRVPEDEDGGYFLSRWKFSTKWVPIKPQNDRMA